MFPEFALKYSAYSNLIDNQNSYLHLTGWMSSFRSNKPINLEGSPIPWMNLPVVAFLEEKLTKDLKLFEFGSGYSTHFYAKRVKTVTSLEYDQSWFQTVQEQVPSNVNMIFTPNDIDGEYCRTITKSNDRYDVVIVDGRDRVNCIKQAIPCLSEQGLIILDDSSREKYQSGIEFAKNHGFRVLNFQGLKATGFGIDQSSIIYRDGNCFKI